MYKCERCGGAFATFKTPGQCPLCGVWASVRCDACGHIDKANIFISNGDSCPKCGSKVTINRDTPSKYIEKCPKCGSEWDGQICRNCGNKKWSCLIVPTAIGTIFIFLLFFIPDFADTPSGMPWGMKILFCGLPGVLLLAVAFIMALLFWLVPRQGKKSHK